MKLEEAIFAGGCFWCMQSPFDELKGVLSTTVGYTGGTVPNPTYEQVCDGGTGHFEAIKITFDPSIISFPELLDIFWHNIDPLDDSGQFADRGGSYRTAVFYLNDAQKEAALESMKAMEAALKAPIKTKILPASTFYNAEDYHQE